VCDARRAFGADYATYRERLILGGATLTSNAYQFRVVVQGISPLIWRRILLSCSSKRSLGRSRSRARACAGVRVSRRRPRPTARWPPYCQRISPRSCCFWRRNGLLWCRMASLHGSCTMCCRLMKCLPHVRFGSMSSQWPNGWSTPWGRNSGPLSTAVRQSIATSQRIGHNDTDTVGPCSRSALKTWVCCGSSGA